MDKRTEMQKISITINWLKVEADKIIEFNNFLNKSPFQILEYIDENLKYWGENVDINIFTEAKNKYIISEIEQWINELKSANRRLIQETNSIITWQHIYKNIIKLRKLMIGELIIKKKVIEELAACETLTDKLTLREKYKNKAKIDIYQEEVKGKEFEYFSFYCQKERKSNFENLIQVYKERENISINKKELIEKEILKIDTELKSQDYKRIFSDLENNNIMSYFKNLELSKKVGTVLGMIDFKSFLGKKLLKIYENESKLNLHNTKEKMKIANDFIDIKPNFFGLGINFNNIFKKLMQKKHLHV